MAIYPDEDSAKPFWKLVADLDIPVFIHPGDATTPAMADYRLASSVGRPADNCLSLSRLIVRGIFEQFPTVKIVGSHLGCPLSISVQQGLQSSSPHRCR